MMPQAQADRPRAGKLAGIPIEFAQLERGSHPDWKFAPASSPDYGGLRGRLRMHDPKTERSIEWSGFLEDPKSITCYAGLGAVVRPALFRAEDGTYQRAVVWIESTVHVNDDFIGWLTARALIHSTGGRLIAAAPDLQTAEGRLKYESHMRRFVAHPERANVAEYEGNMREFLRQPQVLAALDESYKSLEAARP